MADLQSAALAAWLKGRVSNHVRDTKRWYRPSDAFCFSERAWRLRLTAFRAAKIMQRIVRRRRGGRQMQTAATGYDLVLDPAAYVGIELIGEDNIPMETSWHYCCMSILIE